MIATRPAREAFKHIETSGLPYLTQVNIIATTVATDGAIVVVTKIEPISSIEVAAAPLEPENEYTEAAYRQVVTGKCVYLFDLAVFIAVKFTDTRADHSRAD